MKELKQMMKSWAHPDFLNLSGPHCLHSFLCESNKAPTRGRSSKVPSTSNCSDPENKTLIPLRFLLTPSLARPPQAITIFIRQNDAIAHLW